MKIIPTFIEAIKHRMFLLAFIVLALLTIGLVVSSALQIRYSELQLPIRYSSFGITSFYRESWYYLISFAALGGVTLALHTLLSLKLFTQKNIELAVAFLWLGSVFTVIAYFVVFALFEVVALSQ